MLHQVAVVVGRPAAGAAMQLHEVKPKGPIGLLPYSCEGQSHALICLVKFHSVSVTSL